MEKKIKETVISFLHTKKKSLKREEETRTYKVFFEKYVRHNLSRAEYYRIVCELISEYEDDDFILDELYEIELFLLGHCAEIYICRFINELENQEELVKYVRELSWKNFNLRL